MSNPLNITNRITYIFWVIVMCFSIYLISQNKQENIVLKEKVNIISRFIITQHNEIQNLKLNQKLIYNELKKLKLNQNLIYNETI